MKKLLLTIAYPFWFFLAKTMIGHYVLFIAIIFIPIEIFSLINLIFNEVFTKLTGTSALFLTMGVVLISIPFYIIEIFCLWLLGDYMNENYKKLGYKTEL